ncbi:MAG: DUF2726 domain-containing protein [Planctomycetota bacterium]
MGGLILVILILGPVLLALWLATKYLALKQRDAASSDDAVGPETTAAGRYRVREDAVLTQAERNFSRHLERAARSLLDDLGPLRVLAKVNLADLLEPDCANGKRGSPEAKRWFSWWQSINRQHADFVLVDDDWLPVCVIELDDSSHRRSTNRKRDDKKDDAFASARLPSIRFEGKITLDSGGMADAIRARVAESRATG